MTRFEIRDDFYLDGQVFKILSGAIQYFRLHPSQWRETLHNLKALGFNTVETYIPWSLHEPAQGQFTSQGMLDFEAYFDLVQEMGLHLIVRPSPYICAEFDFGGMPPWLLTYPEMRYRVDHPLFLEKVAHFYDWLFPKLLPYQSSQGGPILMMQVENEYGSYAEDKAYMRKIAQMMRDRGVEVPLFTSDGTWIEALEAGTLIEDDIFVTGNFGSQAKENTDNLRAFMARHGKKWPLMCTEFWDGWFNRWSEPIVRREAEDLASDVKEMLQIGSMNLFLLRGGTNFGFINGCSARKTKDLPQVTSYDFDAPINEWGQPTEKYYAVQRVVHELFPDLEQMEPITRKAKAYGSFPLAGTANLLEVAPVITEEIYADYPQAMEKIGQNHGYILYRSDIKNQYHEERLKALETHDRCQFYINQEHLATQYREEIGDELLFSADTEKVQIDVLVENLGRVNYGYKLGAPSQSKGVKGGIMINHQFRKGWKHYALKFDAAMLEKIPFDSPSTRPSQAPSFYQFKVRLTELADTFIDCSAYGKGCISVNGFNLGRYWQEGPIQYLYVPSGLLQEENEFIVFETENVAIDCLTLVDQPVFKDEEEL
ncbi:glycoside hydrolase family 35 protein [Streptococcus oricebi]|uniref:Beta-galactosidase n=1 Tax=Streptococcus oricebi TaxID=1547447 RepID=A0ABS5B400_9STRE|nr:beta-galactosidase family protein [Streptococcus oricebi]MBP2623535.1 beta-galactosidase [Streptococcus oricebi]